MDVTGYARTYSGMSEGELARLVSDGRENLAHDAREALDAELQKRGLSDADLANTYPELRWSKAPPPQDVQAESRRAPSFSTKIFSLAGVGRFKLLAVLISFLAVLITGGIELREAKENELFNAVWYPDTAKSRAALDKLATYRGKHADELLLRIASNPGPFFTDTQVAAIGIVAGRRNSRSAEQLSSMLLHPHEGLAVRSAVAGALVSLPCSVECIRSVLYYEERMWRGERTLESLSGTRWGDAGDAIAKDRADIDQKLETVLVRHRPETVYVLVHTYGIGKPGVSPFALYMVTKLNLRETCDALDIDKQYPPHPREADLMPEFARARLSINRARTDLHCPSSP